MTVRSLRSPATHLGLLAMAAPSAGASSLASVRRLPVSVRCAVIPAAGLGTRFLPATKAVPKELLPIGDTPLLQIVIDEALGAGIDHIVVVSSRSKPGIEAYFEDRPEVIEALEKQGRHELADRIRSIGSDWRATIVYQDQPRGSGPRRRLRPGRSRRPAVRRDAARRADGRLLAARPHERRVRQLGRKRRRPQAGAEGGRRRLRRHRTAVARRPRRRRRHRRHGREARPCRRAERPDHHRPLRADPRRVRRDRHAQAGGDRRDPAHRRAACPGGPRPVPRRAQRHRALRHGHPARLPPGGDLDHDAPPGVRRRARPASSPGLDQRAPGRATPPEPHQSSVAGARRKRSASSTTRPNSSTSNCRTSPVARRRAAVRRARQSARSGRAGGSSPASRHRCR